MGDLRDYGNKRIYILIGEEGVGKKTFTKVLNNHFKDKVQPYYFLDPVKDIAKRYFGYSEEDNTSLAKKFIDIFSEAVNLYCNFSFREMVSAYEDFKRNDYDILIIDMTGATDLAIVQAQLFLDAEIILISKTDIGPEDEIYMKYTARIDFHLFNNDSLEEWEHKVENFAKCIEKYNF